MKPKTIAAAKWRWVAAIGISAACFWGTGLATEFKDPSGAKPFFETWDEEMLSCSMVVAMDGSVLLFEPKRPEGAVGIVVVKRSEDGGKTWGPEIDVGKPVKIDGDMSDGGRYRGPEVGWSGLGTTIVDENTGDIMVFATSLKPAQILYRSKDHGKTWKTEEIVIKPDVNGWLATANSACDPGVTLRYGKKKGRLLVPSRVFWEYVNKSLGPEIFDKHYSNAIYSDDGGKTWTPSAPFPLAGTGEAGLAELSDGRIYYNSRTHARPGNRQIAWSEDGGETWKDQHEDDELFDGPPDVYGCKGGLVRLPYEDRDILVFSSPGSRETRTDITVWVSFDGGQTWPVHRRVKEGPGNYTWLAAGRKGTPSEGMIYLAAGKDWMARFNLAWLLKGQDVGILLRASAAKPVDKYLLLDSRVIEATENATLLSGTVEKHPANPLFGKELPWETGMSHMYPNVIFDNDDKLYKCWYFARIEKWSKDITFGLLAPGETSKGNKVTLYAFSKNGIKWQKPELDVYRYKGKPTNIVVYGDHGTGVFKDLHDPDPTRRFKLLSGRMPHGNVDVAFSGDGIRWTKRQHVADARADTHNNALWAPSLNTYVGITRAYPVPAGDHIHSPRGIRTVLRMQSDDFIDWTKPVEVLRGPTRAAQVYSMPVFWYAGVYIGLPAIYRIDTDKRVHTELAWSPDTVTWNRINPGTQLIPLAEKFDSVDWGCIYAAASPVVLDDKIRIYYSAQKKPHAFQPGWLCMATLRLDGWAGYEPVDDSKPAAVQTRLLTCSAKSLRITADADVGAITISLRDTHDVELARSIPITSSVTAAEVRWLDGFDLATLVNEPIRLRFELRKAKVYSFEFAEN